MSIFKSEYSKNVFTLFGGASLAQAIPIAVSPILTRIYTPDDFGLLALFVALTSIPSVISSGRYEQAILLPKDEESAINIFALCLLLISLTSLLSLVVILIFNDIIVDLLNKPEIKYWLYLLPLSIFLVGLFNLLSIYNVRLKKYLDISKATIIKTIISAFIQLSFGFLKSGFLGLVSGVIFSQLFANLKLLRNIITNKELISKIKLNQIKIKTKRYIDFPKYSLPATLMNTLSGSFINILISSIYSVSTLGIYSLVLRLVSIPTTIIGSSFSKVFYQEAMLELNSTGYIKKIFRKSLFKLFLIGTPIFLLLYLIAEDLFSFVFGQSWAVAGTYTKIVLPFFYIRFISSALSSILSIYEKQKMEFFINFIILSSGLLLIVNTLVIL